ncbi:MAG TPA: hypothetical protein VFC78_09870 [Tepidisphaeraceae bacterium]|nr:hypothetical protein [Tepidisphaeraceae bacterium]
MGERVVIAEEQPRKVVPLDYGHKASFTAIPSWTHDVLRFLGGGRQVGFASGMALFFAGLDVRCGAERIDLSTLLLALGSFILGLYVPLSPRRPRAS